MQRVIPITNSQPWLADTSTWLERYFSLSASYHLTHCKCGVLRPLLASIIKGICLQWQRTGTSKMRCKEGARLPMLTAAPITTLLGTGTFYRSYLCNSATSNEVRGREV